MKLFSLSPALHRSLPRGGRAAVLAASMLAAFAPRAGAALIAGTVNPRTMVFQSHDRLYDIWVPAGYDGSSPVPLVIDMHGYGSNKTQQRQISGFAAQADLHGFVVAYPQGLFGDADNPEGSNLPAGPSWNGGDFCCGTALSEHIDDIGFIKAMASAIEKEGNIDVRRVYVTGLSNGGAMSQRLACAAAATFAAAAPMAFPIGLTPLTKCQPSRPIAVQHYAGLTDTLVPYNGGPVFPSAAASFAYWRDVTPCIGTTPDQTVVYGSSKCETYTNCAGATQIGLCSILASAMSPFPGHVLYLNSDLNLAANAWAFLSQFQAPAPVCGDGVIGAGEECDDSDTEPGDGCDGACHLEPCGPTPETGCRPTRNGAARLDLRDSGDSGGNRLQWKWSKGGSTDKSDFGDPTPDTALWLCVYADGELRSSTNVAGGGTCGNGKPCWKQSSKGFQYRSNPASAEGVTQVSLKAGGPGKAQIQFQGSGANLKMPGPLAGSVVVQLKKAGGGMCWQSTFAEPFKKNAGGVFSAIGG